MLVQAAMGALTAMALLLLVPVGDAPIFVESLAVGGDEATGGGQRTTAGQHLAEGTIRLGGPHTWLTAADWISGGPIERLDHFEFTVDPLTQAGLHFATSTTGPGTARGAFDLDAYFYEADGDYLGGATCTGSSDGDLDDCIIPERAGVVRIAAWYGANLRVTVVAT